MTISKHDLPNYAHLMGTYRKRTLTKAFRLDEPHHIVTSEGTLMAQAGDYVCVDNRGEPYPCAREVFEATYETAE